MEACDQQIEPAAARGTLPRLLIVVNDEAERREIVSRAAGLKKNWEIVFAFSGAHALESLAAYPYAAVIRGGDMVDMTFNPFDSEVARNFPEVQVLARTPEVRAPVREISNRAAPVTPVSIDPAEWDEAVRRTVLVERWLASPAIRSLISQVRKLPVLPVVYNDVVAALRDPNAPFEWVAEFIAKDPVMTAKLLQVVNSAYFGLPERITTATEAVMFLGTERLKGLILVASVFSQFGAAEPSGLSLEKTWKHCLRAAAYAQTIAHWEKKDMRAAEMAFTAGMLHDIGKLLLAANFPAEYRQVTELGGARCIPLFKAELDIFGVSHAEIGGALIGTWGLPYELTRAVGLHHSLETAGDTSFTILTAIHAADVLAQPSKSATEPPTTEFNLHYLSALSLESQRNTWRQLCGLKPDSAERAPGSEE